MYFEADVQLLIFTQHSMLLYIVLGLQCFLFTAC